MFSIQLLGGASIRGENGALHGRGTQRHRLALLALLATSHPRSVARDRLVAMAHRQLARERRDPTRQTTALVHEAYLKLATRGSPAAARPTSSPLRCVPCARCWWIRRAWHFDALGGRDRGPVTL